MEAILAAGRWIAASRIKFGESGDGDGQLSRPSDVAVDAEGYMYVADWGNERVQVLGPDGSFKVKHRGQAGPSKWTEDFFLSNADEKDWNLPARTTVGRGVCASPVSTTNTSSC